MKFLLPALTALLIFLGASRATASPLFFVFFDFDRDVPNGHAQDILDNSILWLEASKATRLRLTGSADRAGPSEYNVRLSRRRGEVVKAELVRRGFPAAAIEVEAVGEDRPLIETADEKREPQNRYVYFEILPPKSE